MLLLWLCPQSNELGETGETGVGSDTVCDMMYDMVSATSLSNGGVSLSCLLALSGALMLRRLRVFFSSAVHVDAATSSDRPCQCTGNGAWNADTCPPLLVVDPLDKRTERSKYNGVLSGETCAGVVVAGPLDKRTERSKRLLILFFMVSC
jgi:hypothetical protein